MTKCTLLAVIAAVVVLAVAGTVAAQSAQRFPDVPPDHPAYAAVEWAAEAGVTLGYGDGTFRPDEPLPRWAAVVFMERYYDEILQASESEDFTRGDMMRVLYEMAGSPSGSGPEPASTTWDGTSTFDGQPFDVLCGQGPAEFTWTLDDEDGTYRWLTLLVWSSKDRDDFYVDIDVTGPNGATDEMRYHGHSEWGTVSFADDAIADIDVGETSFSVSPGRFGGEPSPDVVWGLTGIVTSRTPLRWITSKLQQQWALSVDCDRPSG